MKRIPMSIDNPQLYTYVKTTSVLSKTNPILASAPGNGELRLSITFNNLSTFKFWGGVHLTCIGHFSHPQNLIFLHNHPKAVQWVPIWDAAQKDGNFLSSPGSLVHTEQELFSASWHWMLFQPQDRHGQQFPWTPFHLPVHPPFHYFSPLYYLSWSFSGPTSLLSGFLYHFCTSLRNPLRI